MRQRNEESVHRYMPLSINGKSNSMSMNCAQVYMKVAHCDSTIISNFSTANICTHLTGGRNWCQRDLKKGLRPSHFRLPVQYSANFQTTVNLLVSGPILKMGLSVQLKSWCGLTTDLNPRELNILAPCSFPRKEYYRESNCHQLSLPWENLMKRRNLGRKQHFSDKTQIPHFHRLPHPSLSELDPFFS